MAVFGGFLPAITSLPRVLASGYGMRCVLAAGAVALTVGN